MLLHSVIPAEVLETLTQVPDSATVAAGAVAHCSIDTNVNIPLSIDFLSVVLLAIVNRKQSRFHQLSIYGATAGR